MNKSSPIYFKASRSLRADTFLTTFAIHGGEIIGMSRTFLTINLKKKRYLTHKNIVTT